MLCGIPARAAELEPAYVRTVFDQTNGLPTDEANAVLQTRDGYLWVGSYGGLLRFDGSEFHNFSTEGAIATPAIRCIVQAPDGTLLAGSAGSGIYALAQDGSITKFNYEQGLEDGVVLRILQEEDGRSDYPNQINNVLAFPGIFRGAFDVRASDINEEMKVAAAEALAGLVGDELSEDYIIPAAFDPRVGPAVAKAVAEAARRSGVARI